MSGGGTGWGGEAQASEVGVPPTPNPSPQGGGEPARRLPRAPSFVLDPEGLTPARGYDRLFRDTVMQAPDGCDFDFLTGR
jgi:hypothetical protein